MQTGNKYKVHDREISSHLFNILNVWSIRIVVAYFFFMLQRCSYTHLDIFFNLNIFYCLNNEKRIRHKFFNLVLSSPYTYNIQYDKHYYYIISLKFSHEDMKQKCSNKAECDNVIPLKVTIKQTRV